MPWETTHALCTVNPLRSVGQRVVFILRTDSGSEIGSHYPATSWACNGHTKYEVGEWHQKSLSIWIYFYAYFFSIFFWKGVLILYRLFPSSVVSGYGLDVTRGFKYFLVQSSSRLILLSVSIHSILKKTTWPFFSLLFQTAFMEMYLLHKNIQKPIISPEIVLESVSEKKKKKKRNRFLLSVLILNS